MARSSKTADFSDDRYGLMIQVLGVLLLATGLLCLVSLLSYSPEDPPNSSRPPELAENLAGWFGAQLSYRLLFVVGYGAYALDGLLLVWGWFLFRRKSLSRFGWQTAAILVLMTLFCAASGVPSSGRTHQAFLLGGWLGVTLSSQLLVPYLGHAGSAIFLGTALVVLGMIATNLPIARLPDFAGRSALAVGRAFVAGFIGLMDRLRNVRNGLSNRFQRRKEERRVRREERAAERLALEGEEAEEEDSGWRDPADTLGDPADASDNPVDASEDEAWKDDAQPNEGFRPRLTFPEPELPTELPARSQTITKPKIVTKRHKKQAPPAVANRFAQPVGDMEYELPALDLLDEPPPDNDDVDRDYLLEGA